MDGMRLLLTLLVLGFAGLVSGGDPWTSLRPPLQIQGLAQGLPNSTVYALRLDRSGRLWVGTQDGVAQRMRARRRAAGSLDLETFQPRAVFDGDRVVDIRQQEQNRARQLIEEFMIATNTCTAQFLAQHGGRALRRVGRSLEGRLRSVGVASKDG